MQQGSIEGFQIAPQQKRLWSLQQGNDRQQYRVQCGILIEGALDTAILGAALEQIVDRHEILRTFFQHWPGMITPLQIVNKHAAFQITPYDLGGLDPQTQRARINALIDDIGLRPLDVQHGPVVQVASLVLSPERRLLLIDLPPLSADVATPGILMRELGYAYAALAGGQNLLADTIQFADIAEWQNDTMAAEEAASGMHYWRRKDFSALPLMQLPFQIQSGVGIGGAGEAPAEKPTHVPNHLGTLDTPFTPRRYAVPIEQAVMLDIDAIAERNHTSAATVALACWFVLAWRLIDLNDVVIGVSCDGRKYEEIAEAPGPFESYVPIGCSLHAGLRFSDVLEQISALTREASTWQEYFSWEHLHTGTAPDRELDFFPLCFAFEQWPAETVIDGITLRMASVQACIDRYNVKLTCSRQADLFSACMHYDANTYSHAAMICLAEQYATVLRSALAHPDWLVGELEIIGDRERQRSLVAFNATSADYPRTLCSHQLIEAQATDTPANVAVIDRRQQLTYAELDQRANQLAHSLRALGVGPDVLVGICAERTVEMIIGLLGIWKAGGAYLPLDPSYPRERLAWMLEDARPHLVLTQEHLLGRLPIEQSRVVCLDRDWPTVARESGRPPASLAGPDHLAYVIYTSGTTGRPKGVMVTHGGLVNYLSWCKAAYPLTTGRGSPVHSSLSFDLTVTSVFAPLVGGATVVLLPTEHQIETLREEMQGQGDFSFIKITPAHLELLSQQIAPADAQTRATALIIGGEALFGESLAFWYTHAPKTRLINEYGPTETVVGCSVHEIPEGAAPRGTIPIGRPISNSQIYLLDSRFRPVPIGVPGEIYIGGAGVARGYLNRPDLTAERFVPNPFAQERLEIGDWRVAGADAALSNLQSPISNRLYRTGDIARYHPDDTLEFLGRRDDQVKIRGYRIELGEIEAVLSRHPFLQSAVVVAHKDAQGASQLVAYIVPNRQQVVVDDVRQALTAQLPAYMLPTLFVVLDALPLTPNGKVDRKALPAPGAARRDQQVPFVAPRTPIEQELAAIWCEVLGLEQVSLYDNFFDLGGHSLLLTRLAFQVQHLFAIDLPVRALFDAPTLEGMVLAIAECQITQIDTAELDQVLQDIDDLSPEEIQALLDS